MNHAYTYLADLRLSRRITTGSTRLTSSTSHVSLKAQKLSLSHSVRVLSHSSMSRHNFQASLDPKLGFRRLFAGR